jgi:hypothetical protein
MYAASGEGFGGTGVGTGIPLRRVVFTWLA